MMSPENTNTLAAVAIVLTALGTNPTIAESRTMNVTEIDREHQAVLERRHQHVVAVREHLAEVLDQLHCLGSVKSSLAASAGPSRR